MRSFFQYGFLGALLSLSSGALAQQSHQQAVKPVVAALLELPSVDINNGSSQFFAGQPQAANLITDVYVDTGNVNPASKLPASGDCKDEKVQPIFQYFAPGHTMYSANGNVKHACVGIQGIVSAYAGKQVYVWVSSVTAGKKIADQATANKVATAIGKAIAGANGVVGVGIETTAIISGVIDQQAFFQAMLSALNGKSLVIYQGDWANLSKVLSQANVTAQLALYDVSSSTAPVLSFKNPAYAGSHAPQTVDSYKASVNSRLNGYNTSLTKDAKFHFVLPASASDNIWNKLVAFGGIALPTLSPAQIAKGYSVVKRCQLPVACTEIDNKASQCDYMQAALSQLAAQLKSNKQLAGNFRGLTLYTIRPKSSATDFWQSQALQRKCDKESKDIGCYGVYNVSLSATVLNAISQFVNGLTVECKTNN